LHATSATAAAAVALVTLVSCGGSSSPQAEPVSDGTHDGGQAMAGADQSSTAGPDWAVPVAASVSPSVVSITVRAGSSGDEGSGFVYDGKGDIITNNHVVAAVATENGQITITFASGAHRPGTIVGRDPVTDIAVVHVKGSDLPPPLHLGDSSSLQVGEAVVAIGSPLGLNGTVTTGIISALDRPVTTQPPDSNTPAIFQAIQTDAAVNPGNSGGPLVDDHSRVIGINSAIASLQGGASGQGQPGSIGLGFAIPINQADSIAQQLVTTGKATHPELGVGVITISKAIADRIPGARPGALVQVVRSGGPAAKAGLKQGDIITKVDKTAIDSAGALIRAVRSHNVGDTVQVTYFRDGKHTTLPVTLGELPAPSG